MQIYGYVYVKKQFKVKATGHDPLRTASSCLATNYAELTFFSVVKGLTLRAGDARGGG